MGTGMGDNVGSSHMDISVDDNVGDSSMVASVSYDIRADVVDYDDMKNTVRANINVDIDGEKDINDDQITLGEKNEF